MAVEDRVANAADALVGGGGREDQNADDHAARTRIPKKRIIMLTAFLACLSFVVIVLNAFFSFVFDIVKEDDFWQRLNEFMERVKAIDVTCEQIEKLAE